MAFTTQQINELFGQEQSNMLLMNVAFTTHPNYTIVVDYLTGATRTLQGLSNGHENFSLHGLWSFLQNIDPPSPDDQLVLDVVMHPDVYPYVQQGLAQWLMNYVVVSDTTAAVMAAVRIYTKIGLSNDEIFLLFIYFLQYIPDYHEKIIASDSPVKQYLLSSIPKHTHYRNQFGNIGWGGNNWNFLYFTLLEEGRPQLLKEYLFHGLAENRQDVTAYILRYQQGKYIPLIADWLTDSQSNIYQWSTKLVTAIRLYEINNEAYQQLVVEVAGYYLHDYQMRRSSNKWESNIHFKPTATAETIHLGYSAAAIHFLLTHDKAAAAQLVEDWFSNKVIVFFDVLQVLFWHLQQKALPFLKLGLKADASVGGIEYYRKIINLLVQAFPPENYLELLWQLTASKSRPLREDVSKLLAEKDQEAEAKAIQLLQSKNAESRQTAALILSLLNSANAIYAVKQTLDTEANDNARDILLQIVAGSLPEEADMSFIEAMIQAAAHRGKLSKPVETWLIETNLPALFYKDGQAFDPQAIRFLFYRMSRAKAMRSDAEAKYLLEGLDKSRSAPFAKAIIQSFIHNGAKPQAKYLMTLAAMLGNDETVDKLRFIINNWMEANRTKMAEYGIGALALQGSNKALRLVEYYSRKYKNKTASVGAAALQALTDAAEELGISIHELGDRIVPDFGFSGLYKYFVADGEEYRAFIDSNFKLAFFDEDNKKLKALPTAASGAIKEEFKGIVKEVREIVKSQSLRLEHYLVIQRRWTTREWQGFYLTNPVMFIYATQLLWGIYDANGNLLQCFLCLEDTSLISFEEDEIELDENTLIGIVHPIQLTTKSLFNWKRKLFDMSVQPVFPQLDRSITTLPEETKNKKILYQFDGLETESGVIKTTLEKHGWRKGATSDGGYLDHFIFENRVQQINAVLEVEGVYVGGFGYDADPKLGKLCFINTKKEVARWFSFPQNEEDDRLVPLVEIDSIFYSEVVGSVLCIRQKGTIPVAAS